VSSHRPAWRTLRRRFTLGSGPLKRTSDRVEFLSRVALALVLLLAVPVGLLAGAAAYVDVSATAQLQADTRSPETATLLLDAPDSGTAEISVPTSATWTTPDGTTRTGEVDATPGAVAGTTVDVWVDERGRITERPLTEGEVTGQAGVIGVLIALALVIVGMSSHLVVLWMLERRRYRRWEAGWTSVAPMWVTRFR
jgi:hypothetical protein